MIRDRGFSLVDTAVAVGVAGILGGLLLPLVQKTLEDARAARARHDLNVIAAAIAAQMRDTGGRPMAAGGPGGCTGRGNAFWYSRLPVPRWDQGGDGVAYGGAEANTFANLFDGRDPAEGNALFGLGPGQARDRFRYRGGYLGAAAAGQGDPWGRAYLVFGYNQRGQAANGPIWVVCAGPRGTVAPANIRPDRDLPAAWDCTGYSEGNLAVRVH